MADTSGPWDQYRAPAPVEKTGEGPWSNYGGHGQKPQRTLAQAAKDTGAQLAEGVNTTLGAIPSVVAPQSRAAGFFRDNAQYWNDQQSDVLKNRIAESDKRIEEAGKDGLLSQIGTAASEYWNDPSQAARLVATNLPSMAATLGTGAAASLAARGVAAARGLDAASKAALAAKYGTATAAATKRLAQVLAEIDARDTRTPAPPAPQPATGPVRIGRDNTPLNEGGKPFKTRKAAGDAKKLQPMMRVVTVPGGYALAEKTPAQLAAEERASRRLRNPNTSAPGEPIPAHAFIAAAGGLNRAAAADMGVDGNPRIGNRTLFAGQGRGLSMEQATQMLIQDGYLSEGASINDALALIKTSLTRPQYNADGIERIAEAEVQTQFEDYLAAQEEAAQEDDGFDPFGLPPELTAEDLAAEGYTTADPALQAEVNALVAQAEAAGIDTYDVLDDIVRTYANATQDQYNAAAREALAAAIARSNQDGGGLTTAVAPAPTRSEPEQGLDQPEAPANQAQEATENVASEALELTALSPVQAAAQQDAQEQAAKAEAAAKRAEDAAAKAEDERKRIAQASVRAADTFELGQDPLDSLTGQGSIFDDAPEQPQQAPTATEPVAPTDTGNVVMFSRRSASGNRLPDVVIGHRLGALSSHPDYEAAKAGDSMAAARIASDLVDDAMVEAVRQAAGNVEMIVPVVAVEATGRNKIPLAVARELADRLGSTAETEIVQADSPKRTNMDGLSRLLNPPVFDGPVIQGAAYVLVDDTVTQGGTFASLASHIRDNGGDVAGVVALTGKQYSAKLKPSSELLQQVRDRFQSVEPAFRSATGYGFDALTESEARYLVKHDDAESVRNRILAAGSERINGGDRGLPEATPRSQGQERVGIVSPRTPAATIRAAIAKAYGKLLGQLESKGLVTLTQTQEQAIEAAARARADKTGQPLADVRASLMGSVSNSVATDDLDIRRSANGAIQGFFDPQTGQSFLIADNLTAEAAPGVLMHEVGIHMAADGSMKALFNRAATMLKLQRGNPFMKAVQARMDAAGETSGEEAAAYIAEAYENDRANAPTSVQRWLADLLAAVKAWMFKKGIMGADRLTVADIAAVARANARSMARGDGATGGQGFGPAFSVGEEVGAKALAEFARADELFALPKSGKDTVAGIAADIDPQITVRETRLPGETMYTLSHPAFGVARITERSSNPYGPSLYGYNQVDGEITDQIAERPGDNPEDVEPGTGDVWVDVSLLKPGQGGEKIYAIAANYAHNTGQIFIGDPAGLSKVALRRRLEQMLSSALKFGTTAHLAPHPDQVRGSDGVPPLQWVYGDHVGNVERMIAASVKALDNAMPTSKLIAYDPDRGFYRTDTGRSLARGQLAFVLKRSASEYRLAHGAGAAGQAGWRTIARAALFRHLQSTIAAAHGGLQERGQLLAGAGANVSRLHSDGTTGRVGSEEERKTRIFYSRAATTVATDYTPSQQAAAEKAFGTIAKQTLAERAQAFRANMGTKLRQGLVDQFAPIKEVSQQAYMLARMSKGSDGAVEAALLYGKPFLRDGVTDVNTQDGGFANVLASLKGEHDRFFQWVAAQRAERLKAEGKENLLTDTDIAALRSLNAGKMADGTVRMPLYAKALRELNAFNEASLKVALESGLIDQAAYDLMRDQPYVPFYRLMEEGDMRGPRFSSGLTNQQAWKKLKGGTQQLNADLLQNTLLNWSHLYAAAARNRAALATMTEAENLGIAYQVPADTKGSAKVMRNGVAEHWMVEDPYLLEAISALNYTPGGIVKALAPFKRLLTFGVTVNPTFKIRNLIRDSLSAIAQSDLSYNPAENVAKGWKATSKGSQTYASMLASGGIIKFGTQENTNYLRGQIERLGGTMLDKQGWEKFTGQMRSLWETYEEFGDRAENVNRAALYERLRAKGLSHAEASFQARDLMDFSMSGKWEVVRFLTQTVPFLNARLQGLYKLGRAAKEDPRRFAAMAGAVSMASLALLAAYSDDEDWKKREDWDRDNFWWFKVGEMAFRIPKPFEVGAIGTVAERTAELMLSDEMTGKRFGQRISDMVFNTFAMDPTPQAIKPFLDVYANKDSFSGRAIEGMADERLRPQDRYNERTSEVARLLGSWGLPDPVRLAKGEYAGLSPKQIDFLLRGYFGWLATVSNTAMDAVAKPLLGRGERPEARLRDAFLAGNFVESLPSGSSRYVTAMYEQARDVEQAWASYQAAIKSGDIEKAREIQQDEAPKLRSRMAVANAKSQIADLNARAKRIESDKLMSAQAKRAKLDEIEALRNRVAERVAVRN